MNTFKKVAMEVSSNVMSHISAGDKNSEWQRVNSYVADTLKDAHVLYAKLARLQGDFAGEELTNLEQISENVLDIGGKLSAFSKAFYEGKVSMLEPDVYGSEEKFGGSSLNGESSPAPEEPSGEKEPSGEGSGDVDVEFDYSQDDEESEK